MRDVSDGETVARGIFGLGQDAIEDGEHTFGLRLKPGNGEGNLLGRLPLEKTDLAKRGANACQMEEHLLQHPGLAESIGRDPASRLLGEID